MSFDWSRIASVSNKIAQETSIPSGDRGMIKNLYVWHILPDIAIKASGDCNNAILQITQEQNEYQIEIDNLENEIETLVQEKEEKYNNLEQRQTTLVEKACNGTITEEEKEELKSFKDKYANLESEFGNMNNLNNKIDTVKKTANNEISSISEICSNLVNTVNSSGDKVISELEDGYGETIRKEWNNAKNSTVELNNNINNYLKTAKSLQ